MFMACAARCSNIAFCLSSLEHRLHGKPLHNCPLSHASPNGWKRPTLATEAYLVVATKCKKLHHAQSLFPVFPLPTRG
eukprot:1089665-Amphidinium_carterae.1